ncbi:MAG: tRNA threonylcarbamoyladenosine dehydratase [Desulfobacterales bacterium]|nr:tRNA threonylcarbamoyladenosine dehydratase [Desulfobacterales bacterium]
MNLFTRTRLLLGDENIEKLKNARVAVFGLGAVGSYAVEALARVGVGYLRLVDFDRVDPSNVNRQLYALNSTVGREKAEIAEGRVRDINPNVELDMHPAFVNADSLVDLLSPDLDLVVDAIDGLNSKVNLIVGAREMGLEVVSSMGAGGRLDPTKVAVGDISKTHTCPLARAVRRRLHRRGVFKGVNCVYSLEAPVKSPLSAQDPAGALAEGDAPITAPVSTRVGEDPASSSHGRERPPIGTIPWVPGIFGLTLASEAVGLITRKSES